MFHLIYSFLESLYTLFWGYIGFALIVLLGGYFSLKTGFFQIRALPYFLKTFLSSIRHKDDQARGVSPIGTLFASVGGMVGVGNLVGIVAAIQIGGPGALLWTWVAALGGALIKYSEVYLGLKHRVENSRGGYDGGPMIFLRQAFRSQWIPFLVGILLCFYGVEIYQFSVVADSLVTNWSLSRELVVAILLGLVLYAGVGGVSRVGKISTIILPSFILLYLAMGLWILGHYMDELPAILKQVFISAFTGHAAVGGFAGSSMILAVQHGIARAAYSADIGIGNDSVIQSESKSVDPAFQARLAVCGVFIDNLVCTMSILLVLVTGIWKASDPVDPSLMIQTALSQYFPLMEVFIPVFLLILGYSTIIAYFCVGMKCARVLFPKYGNRVYILYAALILPLFSYLDQSQAYLMMSLAGALLLIINLLGIFKLRKQVTFSLK